MDVDSLAERILFDIHLVFKRDPHVDEFDIIPVLDAQNKSPVVHEGHKFALEAWCVKHLYCYCYKKLFEWKEKKRKADIAIVIQWTVAVLLINPDIPSVWNMRKEMILSRHVLPKQELRFTFIVLTRKSKSPEVFAHRKWLLLNILQKNQTEQDSEQFVEHLINQELDLCTLTASKYCSNYYAWSHRIWVLQKLMKLTPEFLAKEMKVIEEWMLVHVSDHSGMQYRQFLLDSIAKLNCPKQKYNAVGHLTNESPLLNPDKLITNGTKLNSLPHCDMDKKQVQFICNLPDILLKELALVSELLLLYPGHEALWYHRRYIIQALQHNGMFMCNPSRTSSVIKNVASFGPSCKKSKLDTPTSQNYLPTHSLEKELLFLEECYLKSKDDNVQINLISSFKKWLMSFENHVMTAN